MKHLMKSFKWVQCVILYRRIFVEEYYEHKHIGSATYAARKAAQSLWDAFKP